MPTSLHICQIAQPGNTQSDTQRHKINHTGHIHLYKTLKKLKCEFLRT